MPSGEKPGSSTASSPAEKLAPSAGPRMPTERAANGRWLPGHVGKGGRPKGRAPKLGSNLRAMSLDFLTRHSDKAFDIILSRLAKGDATMYLTLMKLVLPPDSPEDQGGSIRTTIVETITPESILAWRLAMVEAKRAHEAQVPRLAIAGGEAYLSAQRGERDREREVIDHASPEDQPERSASVPVAQGPGGDGPEGP